MGLVIGGLALLAVYSPHSVRIISKAFHAIKKKKNQVYTLAAIVKLPVQSAGNRAGFRSFIKPTTNDAEL